MTAPQAGPKRQVMRLRRTAEEVLPPQKSSGGPPKKREAAMPPQEGLLARGQGVELPDGGTLPRPRGVEPPVGPAPKAPSWAGGTGGDATLPRGEAQPFAVSDRGQDPLNPPQLPSRDVHPVSSDTGWGQGQDPLNFSQPTSRDGENFLEELRRQRRRSPQIQDFWEELT